MSCLLHQVILLIPFLSFPFLFFLSVRVANELGFRHPRAAKYAVYVAVFQSFLIGIFFMVLILATRNYFAIIFTSSKDMQQAVANLAYLLGFTMVLNSVQPVISGIDFIWLPHGSNFIE